MAKETRIQIIENTRKKVASQYREEIQSLKDNCKKAWHKNYDLEQEVFKLKNENERLNIKIKEQEDWIERLISFVNMPLGQRYKSIETLKEHQDYLRYIGGQNMLNNINTMLLLLNNLEL